MKASRRWTRGMTTRRRARGHGDADTRKPYRVLYRGENMGFIYARDRSEALAMACEMAPPRWTKSAVDVERGDRARRGSRGRAAHADTKYTCHEHGRDVRHDPKCRVSRPLCKWRRKNKTCYCNALHYPHRIGSVRGCREGGVPDALMKSRAFREAYGYAGRARTRSWTRRRATTRLRRG